MTWAAAQKSALDLVEKAGEGKISGVILLGGEEGYLVSKTGQSLIAALCPTGLMDLSLNSFSAPDSTAEMIISAITSQSLFSRRPVIHLKHLKLGGRGKAGLAGELGGWLQDNHPERTSSFILVIEIDGSIKKRHPLVTSGTHIIEFSPLSSYSVGDIRKDAALGWVNAYTLKSGKKISNSAFSKLRRRTANNLWALAGELDKLVSFIGSRDTIEDDDVKSIVARSWEDQIFDLIEAVANRKADRSLFLMSRLFQGGMGEMEICRMLTRQFRLLLQARCAMDRGELAAFHKGMRYFEFRTIHKGLSEKLRERTSYKGGLADLHPYPFYRTIEQCTTFSPESLLKSMNVLFRIERAMKSGTKEIKRLLELFVIYVANDCTEEFVSDADPFE